ncbi:MAG: GxxExxY protein [Ferruginibacter sp.]
MISKKFVDELEYLITGACIEVHKTIGPGLLESVYKNCLIHELSLQEIPFVVEQSVRIDYKGLELDVALSADIFVANAIVVELKAVKEFIPIYDAQLLTYMKLLQAPKGILINFCCTNIVQNGKKSFVNEFYRDLL